MRESGSSTTQMIPLSRLASVQDLTEIPFGEFEAGGTDPYLPLHVEDALASHRHPLGDAQEWVASREAVFSPKLAGVRVPGSGV
jgi:hypothetical protein